MTEWQSPTELGHLIAEEAASLRAENERLQEENELLWQLLAPFALFAKPAALEIAGGDPNKIGKTIVQQGNQALCWGAFLMAREEWDAMVKSSDERDK